MTFLHICHFKLLFQHFLIVFVFYNIVWGNLFFIFFICHLPYFYFQKYKCFLDLIFEHFVTYSKFNIFKLYKMIYENTFLLKFVDLNCNIDFNDFLLFLNIFLMIFHLINVFIFFIVFYFDIKKKLLNIIYYFLIIHDYYWKLRFGKWYFL